MINGEEAKEISGKPTAFDLTKFERDVLEMIINRVADAMPNPMRAQLITQITTLAGNIASRAYASGWSHGTENALATIRSGTGEDIPPEND